MSRIKQAFRQLTLHAGLSAVVISMLAIGIGGATALFAIFYEVAVEPLPVPEPTALVNLRVPGQKPGYSRPSQQVDDAEAAFSYPLFLDLEAEQDAFAGLAAHYDFFAQITSGSQTEGGRGLLVSGGYFDVLNLRPALGRLIGPQDTPRVGEADVAVLSHDYWQSRFGSDPAVLGQTVTVNDRALTIVGVAPANFFGTLTGWRPEVFVPLTLRWAMQPEMPRNAEDRAAHWVHLFARLRPGVDARQAAESVNRRFAAILAEAEAPLLTGLTAGEREQFLGRRIVLDPGARGQNPANAASMPAALMLGATLLVLVIACINVANLLLARGAVRAGEMAIRAAVGASRGRLVAQLLLESLVLAALGGALSLPAATAALAVIKATLLPAELAQQVDFQVDSAAILFALAAAGATVLLFGLIPAVRAGRADPARVIKAHTPQLAGARSRGRLRGGLVPVQIALSMILLVLAGLFTRSLVNVSRAETGMDLGSVVVFSVSPLIAGYDGERLDALYERITQRLGDEPAIRSVASAAIPPLSGLVLPANVAAADGGAGSSPFTQGNPMSSPGLFATLAIPFVAGRDFTAADSLATPASAIVNEEFVRAHGLGPDAVGRSVRIAGPFVNATLQIVGVIRDVRYSTIKRRVLPQLYTPVVPANTTFGTRFFYVKTAADPDGLLVTIPRILAEIDPSLPVANLTTLARHARDSTFGDRLVASLAASFAVLATALTAIGLYGVLSYNVARRTRELGLRLALGAAPDGLLITVLKQVAAMAAIGAGIGLVLALALSRAMSAALYGLSSADPVVIAAAVAVIGAIVLGASYVPARRASRIEPMRALRYE
jgi:putative ABC transport system permease protein